ncbi:ESF1 homolog isoform X2 [Ictalurus furcatus]|uniref:ESF1 homolog isoform X2 n=1 Tax=Ictalurus furcatus TaxID=66913 RepID=UPI00234FE667|nr:ESF1 homolog isoform X2 [Ictalurus furcatus]
MSSKKEPGADERFARVKKDPRFWEMPDVEQKVRIDKRFQSMFHDERFKLKYTVDKRGRPVNHTSTEDLKRFYKLSDSEQSDAESDADAAQEEQKKKKKKKKKTKKAKAKEDELQDEKGEEPVSEKAVKKKALKSSECDKIRKAEPVKGVRVVEEDDDDDDDDDDEDDEEYSDTDKGVGFSADDDDDDDGEEDEDGDEDESESEDDSDSGPDLARGKGNIETSSEEEDEVEDILHHEEEEIEHDWGEMWKDAPRTEQVTCRLAVCNMNWDRLKAKDLLALFSSFKPKGGAVLSVTIYPSEFGKERLKAEQTQGPLELTSLPDDPDADTEDQRIYREKVRDYQFKRLRYYYAVVECDSPETAAKIYEECDGFEYESSCSTLDLRFIPDSMTFEDEAKDRATDVDLSTYKPKLFTSTATTTAKVELTWDETDHDRITTLSKNFNKDELLNMDFQAYLASSSEDEEDEVEAEELKPAERATEEDEKKGGKKGKKEEEQIAKYRQLLQSIQDKDRKEKDKDMEMEITWVPGLKESAEKLVKKKMEGKDNLTPWEEFLEKKKEKKKEKRKGKKEAEAQDETAISDDELPPDVDLDDPFFSEELGGATGTAQKVKKSKKSKKGEEQLTAEEEAELEKRKAEIALLMDDDDEKHRHFNYDQIVEQQNLSKKKKKKLLKNNTLLEEDNFKVDLQDPRFQAMFTSHLYNLDPSDPAYKKTRGTRSILEEKQRRREEQQRGQQEALQRQENPSRKTEEKESTDGAETRDPTAPVAPSKALDPSLSLLIKSVKNKTEQFHARKKQRTK